MQLRATRGTLHGDETARFAATHRWNGDRAIFANHDLLVGFGYLRLLNRGFFLRFIRFGHILTNRRQSLRFAVGSDDYCFIACYVAPEAAVNALAFVVI